jgi:hypothetical protein
MRLFFAGLTAAISQPHPRRPSTSSQLQSQARPTHAWILINMGKTRRAMIAFIDESPDPKLEGGISSGTIYTDYRNFRIDMQGVGSYLRFQFFRCMLTFFTDNTSQGRQVGVLLYPDAYQ